VEYQAINCQFVQISEVCTTDRPCSAEL